MWGAVLIKVATEQLLDALPQTKSQDVSKLPQSGGWAPLGEEPSLIL